jgi:16S rRNA (uracil1498-N3)-methyltransferase
LPAQNVILFIGPEGGFTPEEIALAMKAGFQAVSLGKRILRTETAGIAAISTIHAIWDR